MTSKFNADDETRILRTTKEGEEREGRKKPEPTDAIQIPNPSPPSYTTLPSSFYGEFPGGTTADAATGEPGDQRDLLPRHP